MCQCVKYVTSIVDTTISEFLDETLKCYLQEKVLSNLIARETTDEMFIQKLAEGKTNGIDIAILAICELFDISIIVLLEKYLWKSDEIPLDDFDICLIVFSKGKYMSASRRDNTKVEVEYPESLATSYQIEPVYGSADRSLSDNSIGHSRKCKVGYVCAELGDHNYSANIEDHDILNGSNSSCILGVYNYLSELHEK